MRSVVLSGEGRAFCAGLDFSSFAALAGGPSPGPRPSRQLFDRDAESPANFAQRAALIWTELPVPVIAAIHGVAYGGGLQIALGADIRYVAPDARLSVMEVKWGLVPDMSGTQTLRHLVRLDVAKELAFTGRVVGGSEAVGLGLATHLSDTPQEAARALAREIAGKSPEAVRAAKRLLSSAFVSGTEEGLRLEQSLQGALLGQAEPGRGREGEPREARTPLPRPAIGEVRGLRPPQVGTAAGRKDRYAPWPAHSLGRPFSPPASPVR